MIEGSYCGGRPCEGAVILQEAERAYTDDINGMIEVGFELLDIREAADETGSVAATEVHHKVQELRTRNEQMLNAFTGCRELLQSRLQYCETCPGVVQGICPTFPLQAEPNSSEVTS